MLDKNGTSIKLKDWVMIQKESTYQYLFLHLYGQVNMVSEKEIHIGNIHWLNKAYNLGQSMISITESAWITLLPTNITEREQVLMLNKLEQ